MKRQRRVDGSAAMEATKFEGTTTTMAMGSKKAKRGVEKKGKEDVGKVEEVVMRRDIHHIGGDHEPMGLVRAENHGMGVGDEEDYWGCLNGVVDEQMSWGSIWLPFWDVEFMGEARYGLFSYGVWDDDIWGLRTIKEVPNPSI